MIKRLFDLLLSALLLLLLSPVIAIIALLVRAKLGRPVFFLQERPGLHENVFTIVKFRTMLDAQDAHGAPLPDAERLTPFGRMLRSISLDELPELWNVLRGEMSFVGPRPLLVRYLHLYSDEQRRRHEVRPGLTGWAQINGRNGLSWQEKLAQDVWYVDNRTFVLDLKILMKTVAIVVRREGISAADEATMSAFEGNEGKSP